MSNNPIGIFDSGIGGLSVFIKVSQLLPNENFIYLADNGNCPYGNKSKDEIIRLAEKNTKFLLDKGCKCIVVACNTATSVAISYLRRNFNVPFVGIEPAIKPAATTTKTGVVGVLATKGTFEGDLFKQTSERFASDIDVIIQQGVGLVELVEQNKTNTNEAKQLLQKYIKPMIDKGADRIVLGCTHYPFFTDEIKKIIPNNVQLINPALAVSKQVQKVLVNEHIQNNQTLGKSEFYFTGKALPIQDYLKKLSE